MKRNKIKRVAIMENFGADFFHYRIPLTKFLISQGYNVIAIVPNDESVSKIRESGITVESYDLARNSLNPIKFLKSILQIRRIIKRNQIDLLHTFRLQPNLYGTLAAILCKTKFVINHITGLGVVFSFSSLKNKVLQFIILLFYKIVFIKSKKVIFQNPDDIEVFKRILSPNKICLIKGSGINHIEFAPDNVDENKIANLKKELQVKENTYILTLVSRLIWQKGIREFAEAAKILNKKYNNLQFVVVGASDPNNPYSVDNEFITNNSDEVKFLGRRSDVKEILSISSIFVLPSYYREGIPRSILEAMAMEKPIITTNMPGCKLTIDDNKNGILINPQKVKDIVEAVSYIIDNKKIVEYGLHSRQKLVKEFSEVEILEQILDVYINI